jgi:threonine dehydrogenase-like Zn-dependent dehydrogenase
VKLVRRGGRVILFGVNQHAQGSISQYAVTRHEISILGSFIQRTAFPQVVRLLEAGLVPVETLITHRLSLGEVGRGLDAMRAGSAIKAVVTP